MLGVLRYINTRDQSNVEDVKDGVCGFYATLYTEYSYSSHSCQRCRRCQILLYSVYSSLSPLQGKAIYLSLPPCGFSGSPPVSPRRALLTFLDLTTTRVIAGKMLSQSPILKSKGVLSNPVILTYLWEQSCILHTLNCLPSVILVRKVSSMLEECGPV